MTEDKYVCPNCGSSNIIKLSIIHRNGITSSEGEASQYRDFLGTNDTRIIARSQSAASEAAAPPGHPIMLFIGWIVWELGAAVIGFLIAAAIQYFLGRSASIWINIVTVPYLLFAVYITYACGKGIIDYPKDRAKWNNSYHCQRCDTGFVLEL
jgi:predicted RNA-binding Zn-ribbon protein involved in translation (DUF1610 family)